MTFTLCQTSVHKARLRAAGFRNIAVHNYHAIDWRIVHLICPRYLRDFQDFAHCVIGRISTY